ncbi:hypothetical protein CCHR01_19461 [Colletotrichum chrysophilum]|uniref:Uncharacterized protein n=1 Tax=Colletotrichum chrysophilum TaxID=1836956 RepID=A0AAD9E7T0_9PEZI|nr:hypothetical protein CCHR01_19461 [Colletotrichum chrysophilum]
MTDARLLVSGVRSIRPGTYHDPSAPPSRGKRAGEGGICVQVLAPSTRAFPATFGGARREGAAPSILTEETTACQLEMWWTAGNDTESDTRSRKKAHDLPPEVVNIQTEDSQIGQGHEEQPTVDNPPSTTARSPLLAGLAGDAGHQSTRQAEKRRLEGPQVMRQSFFLAQPPTGATQSWQSPGNGNAILPVTRPGRTLPYGYTLRCFCSSAPPAELMVLSPTRRRWRRSAQRRRKTQAASVLFQERVVGSLMRTHSHDEQQQQQCQQQTSPTPANKHDHQQHQHHQTSSTLYLLSVAQLALAPHLSPHPSSLPGLPQYCLSSGTRRLPAVTDYDSTGCHCPFCSAAVVMQQQQQQQQQQLLPAAVDVAAAAPLGIGLLLPPAPALAVFVSHLPFPIFCICGNIKRGRNRNSSSDGHLTLTISLYAHYCPQSAQIRNHNHPNRGAHGTVVRSANEPHQIKPQLAFPLCLLCLFRTLTDHTASRDRRVSAAMRTATVPIARTDACGQHDIASASAHEDRLSSGNRQAATSGTAATQQRTSKERHDDDDSIQSLPPKLT